MSNRPFGLRGDPFVPPATLSAKEASRLIRRRVRACNGDGGLLFPIDTCDTIHALARGVPDAVLALAGKSLAVAAADGARAVSPAHVKRAAEDQATAPSGTGAGEPRAAGAGTAPPAVDPHDAEPVVQETTPPRSGRRTAAGTDPRATAARARESTAPAPEPVDALDEADDDLPPFRPASMALPTQPSEHLPEEAREWVSRFISGPSSIAQIAEDEPPRARRAPPQHVAPAPAAVSRPRVPEESEAEPVYAAPAPRRRARPRPGRRQNTSRPLLVVLGVVAVLAIVLRYSTPGHLATPAPESARPVRAAAPATDGPSPAPPPTITVVPPRDEPPTSPQPATDAPQATPTAAGEVRELFKPPGPAAGESSARVSGSVPEPATGERARPASAPSKFALEVASFIFEDRARQERDRLVAAGLRARIVTTLEFGSRVYRVVIGGYPHPAAAERAADSLLSNGLVLQARVVSAHPSH